METFGQKLREAIDGLGLGLEDVARETGFEVHHLEALQRDECGALPDDEIVIEHLRAFAALVKVDPQEVIDDYLAERAQQHCPEPDPLEALAGHDVPQAPEVILERPVRRLPMTPRSLAAGLVALALLVAGFLWLRPPSPPSAPPVSVENTAPPVAQAPTGERATQEAKRPAATTPNPVAPASTVERDLDSGITIARYGVGRGVVDHELVGEARQFAEGTRVWFWTQVQGATAGQTIRHVWLYEGREMLSVPLRLGAERWRTQSYKNLHTGSEGKWVVEARDEKGQVLARSAFACSEKAAG